MHRADRKHEHVPGGHRHSVIVTDGLAAALEEDEDLDGIGVRVVGLGTLRIPDLEEDACRRAEST